MDTPQTDLWSMLFFSLAEFVAQPMFYRFMGILALLVAVPAFIEIVYVFFDLLLTYVVRSSPQAQTTDDPPYKMIDAVIEPVHGNPPGECRVCFGEFTRPVKIKQCGHIFCDACIRSTLTRILHCPLDTRELFSMTVQPPGRNKFHIFANTMPGLGAAMLGSFYLCIEGLLGLSNTRLAVILSLIFIPAQRIHFFYQFTTLRRSTVDLERVLGLARRRYCPWLKPKYRDLMAFLWLFAPWTAALVGQIALLVVIWLPLLDLLNARTGEDIVDTIRHVADLGHRAIMNDYTAAMRQGQARVNAQLVRA